MSPDGVRGVMAAADQVEARIVAAEKLRAALEEIRRLHAAAMVWEDTAGAVKLLQICVICCLDTGGYRTDECEESHEHTADGPGCSTTEIIARTGL